MLGSAEIEAGHYQQIRVILADNGVSVNGNKCGSAANCVMLTSDPNFLFEYVHNQAVAARNFLIVISSFARNQSSSS